MSSNRRGQSQSALRAVQGRHEAIQKIERQMVELAQLFQDMEAAVIEQEPAVMDIEQKGEDTVVNLGKGNEHLDKAVVKARSARKKKWICLGIGSKSSPGLTATALTAISPHSFDRGCHYRRGCLVFQESTLRPRARAYALICCILIMRYAHLSLL